LLRYLGVADVVTQSGSAKDPLVAANGLREMVDRLSPGGPVLIIVDDLQWADQESVEALYWLARRAKGDRLLIAVGSRPEGAGTSDAWRRLIHQTSRGAALSLSGLSLEQAAAMVLGLDPAAGEQVILRLWEHTGGNPFHLDSLLRQYGFAELAAMRTLPAPAELANRMRAELQMLAPDAVALAHASAVLGYSWQDIPTLAAVGEVGDASRARQALVDAGLLVPRRPEMSAPLRSSHALVRAAMYQSIPYARRRELHLRAAAQVSDEMDVLEHRVAAADRYDDALAAELQQAAEAAHGSGDFRRAGCLLSWSSGLTAHPANRNRRWLDGAFDMILARDIAEVRQQLPAVRSAPDLARRALVQGLLLGAEKRWLDAWAAFTAVPDDVLRQVDPVTRYRLLVLTAWSMICVGRDVEELAPLLAQTADGLAQDPALVGNEIFCAGMLRMRRSDRAFLDDTVGSVPSRSSATPAELTYKLAWRGSVLALWGEAALAEADLLEVTARIRTGVADNGDGVYNGLLAFAHWQRGAWSLAGVQMGIALDCAIGQPHPMNRAVEPMLLAVRGELGRADDQLREAEDVLRVMPWREAAHLYVISYIVRLHAGADPGAQRAALAHLRHVFGDTILEIPGFTGAVWIFHLAIAALWAGDLSHAETLIRASELQPRPPGWAAWVPSWLRGLIAEAAGSGSEARQHIDTAISRFSDDLPLYRAHVLADHARIARLQGDTPGAGQSLKDARQLYRVLGAAPYLQRAAPGGHHGQPGAEVARDVLSPLSDRERDVATLLISGLTYAQIAQDLYVTRATVGFHTTRIYAKTGVSSRAQLIDLVRGLRPSVEN
jgi:DNA-binding CsgD family transcriptional regulator